jgi:hypothetical protein
VSSSLQRFERITRAVSDLRPVRESPEPSTSADPQETHPFETRNIHPDLPKKVRRLFDDGHTEQAVFEASTIKRRPSLCVVAEGSPGAGSCRSRAENHSRAVELRAATRHAERMAKLPASSPLLEHQRNDRIVL